MPDKKIRSSEEILGIKPQPRTSEEILGIRPPASTPQAPPQQPAGVFESLQSGLAGPLLRNVVESAADPLGALERVGRAGLELVSAFDPVGATSTAEATARSQAARVAELKQRAAEASPEFVKSAKIGQQAEEARPRTTAGNIAYGVGSFLGETAFPSPESLGMNIVTGPFAGAGVRVAGKAIAPILQRLRGRIKPSVVVPETAPVPLRPGTVITPSGQRIEPLSMPELVQLSGGRLRTPSGQIIEEFDPTKPTPPSVILPDIPATPPPTFQRTQVRGAGRGQLGPEPGSAGREVRPDPTLYDPLESGGFYEEPAAAPRRPISTSAESAPPQVSLEIQAQLDEAAQRYQFSREAIKNTGGDAQYKAKQLRGLAIRYSAEKRQILTNAAAIRQAAPTPQLTAPILSFDDLAMSGQKPSLVEAGLVADTKRAQSPLVQPSEKTKAAEIISATVKAGLLTNPTTHLKNVGGTGAFQVSEELANLGASILDVAVSKVTGRRSLVAPSPASVLRSIKTSFDSIPQMKQILRTGIDPEAAVRQELSREINSGNKILNVYVNGVFRLLKAEDKFFRAGAYTSALENRASTQAINEAKQGLIPRGSIGARATELRTNPTEAMRADAIGDSLIAIFANENFAGRALERIRNVPGGENIKRAFDLVVPFVSTPTNILARMIDYSPIGFTKSAGTLAKGLISKAGFTQEAQRNFVKTFGRASVGSGLIVLGYKLGQAGLATGLFEGETPSQTEREKAAGRPPGAIRIGNKWIPVNAFPPLGPLIAIGATLAREDKQAGKQRSLPSARAASKQVAIRSITEQPLLEGPYNLVNAGLQYLRGQEGAYDKAAGKFAGMYVPSIVSGAAEAIDPMARQREGFAAQIQARIPGLRQQLPPAVDALGQPIQNAGPIGAFFDPFGMRTETQSPVLQELVRLDQGLTKLGKKDGESVESYQARVKIYGDLYQEYGQQLLNNPQFINSKDDTKREALKSLGSRVKDQLRHESENRRGAAPRQVRLAPIIVMRAVIDAERERQRKKPGK